MYIAFCFVPVWMCRRSAHNVPMEKIRHMLNGYDRFVTIQSIMGSCTPEVKRRQPQENTCALWVFNFVFLVSMFCWFDGNNKEKFAQIISQITNNKTFVSILTYTYTSDHSQALCHCFEEEIRSALEMKWCNLYKLYFVLSTSAVNKLVHQKH